MVMDRQQNSKHGSLRNRMERLSGLESRILLDSGGSAATDQCHLWIFLLNIIVYIYIKCAHSIFRLVRGLLNASAQLSAL
jgi:hypothetical protein